MRAQVLLSTPRLRCYRTSDVAGAWLHYDPPAACLLTAAACTADSLLHSGLPGVPFMPEVLCSASLCHCRRGAVWSAQERAGHCLR